MPDDLNDDQEDIPESVAFAAIVAGCFIVGAVCMVLAAVLARHL